MMTTKKEIKFRMHDIGELMEIGDMPPVDPYRFKKGEYVIEHGTESVVVCGEALDKILWRGRQWAVTTHGIECLDGLYHLDKERVMEGLSGHSVMEHMASKGWVDYPDFVTALAVAMVVHGKNGKQFMKAANRGDERRWHGLQFEKNMDIFDAKKDSAVAA